MALYECFPGSGGGGCFAPDIQADLDALDANQFMIYNSDGTKVVKTLSTSQSSYELSGSLFHLIVIDANKVTFNKISPAGSYSSMSSCITTVGYKDGTKWINNGGQRNTPVNTVDYIIIEGQSSNYSYSSVEIQVSN